MSDWVREECVPSKEILQNVLASGHDDFTAMEDIIDNSVEALSSVVGEPGYKPEIKVTISEESIEILDNGCGMSNAQARNAMRLGSHIVQEPSAGSIPHDKTHFLFGSGRLGHFGVGVKLAPASWATCWSTPPARKATPRSLLSDFIRGYRREKKSHCGNKNT